MSSSHSKNRRPQHSHRAPRGHRKRNREPREHGPRKEHVEELHPTAEPPEVKSFDEWDLGEDVQRAIHNMDIRVPTPIQALSIGSVLSGRDVIAKAETGTGKTLAFGAPMMSRIDAARATVLSLVLCPTRELAQQVWQVLSALGFPRGVRVALVVGGDPIHPQIAELQAGAQVIVGTPGRVLDLYEQGFLRFPWTEFVVLDEADKMFEIGFLDDIKKILSLTPDERQTLLFSATFPTEVLKLARAETRDPIEVATARGTVTVDSIDQFYMEMDDEERPVALRRLLDRSAADDVFLVFLDRRTEVDRLLRRMERLPYGVKALHGGYDQASRFRVMSAFRTGEVKALLATDVASRGLDVEHVTHVINFSVPRDIEDYTHRVGRTGRAGRSGTAITFVAPAERRRWRAVLGRANWEIAEVDPPGASGAFGRERSDSRARRREGPERERGSDGERDAEDRRPRREPESRQRSGDRPRGGERRGRGRRDEGGERALRSGDAEEPRRRRGRSSSSDGERGGERGRRDASRGPKRGGRGRRTAGADREDRPAKERRDEPGAGGGTEGFGAGL